MAEETRLAAPAILATPRTKTGRPKNVNRLLRSATFNVKLCVPEENAEPFLRDKELRKRLQKRLTEKLGKKPTKEELDEEVRNEASKLAWVAEAEYARGLLFRYQNACQVGMATYFNVMLETASLETKKNGQVGRKLNWNAVGTHLRDVLQLPPGEKEGKTISNQLRPLLSAQLIDLNSNFVDAAWEQIQATLKSDDPNVNATRGFLMAQNVRTIPRFQRLPLPLRGAQVRWHKHRVLLSVGSLSAPRHLEFRAGDLEPGRWAIWHKLAAGPDKGGYKCGRFWLHHDPDRNAWQIRAGYELPASGEEAPDPERVLAVEILAADRRKFLTCEVCEGQRESRRGINVDFVFREEFSALACLRQLTSLQKQQEQALEEKGCCGRRTDRRQQGLDSINEAYVKRQERLTLARDRTTKLWNHTWTIRLINAAKRKQCGTIRVYELPPAPLDEEGRRQKDARFFGFSWPWAQFRDFLTYKAKTAGIRVEFRESPTVQQVHQAHNQLLEKVAV